MGMWDKDKLFPPDGRLDQLCPPGPVDKPEGTTFILWSVEVKGEMETEIGTATMTWLVVSPNQQDPDTRYTVGTLSSAIADKAAEAEASDFPAIVQTRTVSTDKGNDALVLQFIREFDAPGKKGK